MAFVNLAIADTSSSFNIDVSELNGGLTVQSSPSYKVNDTLVGFVEGGITRSTSFQLGSGLIYLETLCGNGYLEFGEACDDGNLDAGDGCSSICQIEPPPPPPPGGGGASCGNGNRDGSEQCDDGNNTNGDGCSSICRIEIRLPEPEPEPKPEPEEPIEEELPPEEKVFRTIKFKARPEKRVNPTQNWGLSANVSFYNKDLGRVILRTPIQMNNQGWGLIETENLPDGSYNIAFKGLSHLVSVVRSFEINSDLETIDFTFGDRFYLLAGDVHRTKDNFVNGLDIASAVNALYTSNIHADLNRDSTVNGLDLSIVVNNLYKSGERL